MPQQQQGPTLPPDQQHWKNRPTGGPARKPSRPRSNNPPCTGTAAQGRQGPPRRKHHQPSRLALQGRNRATTHEHRNDVNQPDATAAQHPTTPEGGGPNSGNTAAGPPHPRGCDTHTPPPASHAHPRRHLPQLQPQSHLHYAVPPDVNQWGYTLIYHPPLDSPAATTTTAHTVTPAAPLCPQPPQDQDTCDPQPVCDRPSKPLQQQQRTTASTTPQRAPQPPEGDSTMIRNRCGRGLQRIEPRATP